MCNDFKMDALDLEELESHLYSQVYHGEAEDLTSNNSDPIATITTAIEMKRPNCRYFGYNKGKSPAFKPQNKTDGYYSKNSGKILPPPAPVVSQVLVYKTPNKSRLNWREKRRLKRLIKKQTEKEEKSVEVPSENITKDVIELSDSDNEDSCIIIEDSIIKNDSLADDVIFVEPENVAVINLDNDEENETNSIKQLHKERKELLSTPDSASNDFMNNTEVELNKKKFNFSLHGSDFKVDFVKPMARNETTETESTSSTTDANSINLSKSGVFDEVDFPRDIFSEGNLESFSNFITPLRPCLTDPSDIIVGQGQIQCSTSSSKKLPDLSPMISKKIVALKKKSKKNLGSKFDLIDNPDGNETKKKKKKNKKKKSFVESVTEDVVLVGSDNNDNLNVEVKPKKRRSSQLEMSENDESQLKRKPAEDEACIKSEPNELGKNTMENSSLEGLVIVDETFADQTTIALSDSDTVLSSLHEAQDIQLSFNIEEISKDTQLDLSKCSVLEIQQNMSDDPNVWTVSDKDINPPHYRYRKCNRCNKMGHTERQCRKKNMKCTLCGSQEHFEPRCPNKICTQCGHRSAYLTTYCTRCFNYRKARCKVCDMVGHLPEACPDLWRRYHLTTSDGPLKRMPGKQLKPKNLLWCSGCAKPGHLDSFCRNYQSIYPAATPRIISYEDIYREKVSLENSSNLNRTFQPPVIPSPNINYPIPQPINLLQNQIVFLANQPNLYSRLGPNLTLYNNSLPGYISFPDRTPQKKQMTQIYKTSNSQCNSIFFSSATAQIHHFVNSELFRLSKFTMNASHVLLGLQNRSAPDMNQQDSAEYYATSNMLMFGVFKIHEGNFHLGRLKMFKRSGHKSKVNHGCRRQLYKSYCYIFGPEPHQNVDYRQLLHSF